jgi:ankyrin repeat protein
VDIGHNFVAANSLRGCTRNLKEVTKMFRRISSSVAGFLLMLTVPTAALVQAGELQDAVKANDVPRVEALLAAGTDINDSDLFGTPLHMAVARGSLEMVNLLIDRGADLEAEASAGQRYAHPVHTAAQANQAAVLEILAKRGAKIDARNGDGETALIIAARNGYLNVAQTLVDAGADPLGGDSTHGYTPIHMASAWGRLDLVKYFLSIGVDVNLRTGPNGETPLWWAAADDRPEVVEYLLENGAGPNIADKSGKIPAQVSPNRAIRDALSNPD